MKGVSTTSIVGAIFGAILIFYLIGSTFNDASAQLDAVNSTYKGAGLMKLLGLFLAFGVCFAVYKMFAGQK
jgi:hypothetical protein